MKLFLLYAGREILTSQLAEKQADNRQGHSVRESAKLAGSFIMCRIRYL